MHLVLLKPSFNMAEVEGRYKRRKPYRIMFGIPNNAEGLKKNRRINMNNDGVDLMERDGRDQSFSSSDLFCYLSRHPGVRLELR
jgi:hypothetical protein